MRLRMSPLPVRSPAAKVGGIVYFGRMLDKIRADAKGELPPEYQANLGKGFDASCTAFLRVNYNQIVELVKQAEAGVEHEWSPAELRKYVLEGHRGVSLFGY